jgi:hypothetical protein
MTNRSNLNEDGLPEHGSPWGDGGGIAVRYISRGEGQPVTVTNPHPSGAPPRRMSSEFTGTSVELDRAHPSGASVKLTPQSPAGTVGVVILEY